MIKRILISSAAILLVLLFSPVLFRKRTVLVASVGGTEVVATRPLPSPWRDNQCDVYLGKSRVFSLWMDLFDFPIFIYPFSDGQRILSVYDDDTAVLVFVVDMSSKTTATQSFERWPPDDYVRNHIAGRATNVVFNSTGLVRLPTLLELQEASDDILKLSASKFRAESFPTWDFGLYRFYWSKEDLLPELATNRTSVW